MHHTLGGLFTTDDDFLLALRGCSLLAMEETLFDLLMEALVAEEIVFVDEIDSLRASISRRPSTSVRPSACYASTATAI
jgi:hypothetical protein